MKNRKEAVGSTGAKQVTLKSLVMSKDCREDFVVYFVKMISKFVVDWRASPTCLIK